MAPVKPAHRFTAPRPGLDLSVAFTAGLLLLGIVLGGLTILIQIGS